MRAHKFLTFSFFIMGLVVFSAANAATSVPPTCDAGFYEVLSDRAWMEGQREMEVAQKLILKPDSVLEYSCFNDLISGVNTEMSLSRQSVIAAQNRAIGAGDLSATQAQGAAGQVKQDYSDIVKPAAGVPRYYRSGRGGPTYYPAPAIKSLAAAQNQVGSQAPTDIAGFAGNLGASIDSSASVQAYISPVMQSYLSSNFGHDLAGDLLPVSPICGAMFAVWDFLKCRNFDKDDFLTFEELIAADPRTLPAVCNSPTRNAKWQNAIVGANPIPRVPAAFGGMAKTNSYLDALDPANCTAITPVLTGLLSQGLSPHFNPSLTDQEIAAMSEEEIRENGLDINSDDLFCYKQCSDGFDVSDCMKYCGEDDFECQTDCSLDGSTEKACRNFCKDGYGTLPRRQARLSYEEAVCPAAGCAYQPGASGLGKCVGSGSGGSFGGGYGGGDNCERDATGEVMFCRGP